MDEKPFCKDCTNYDRQEKKCAITNGYTARKKSCNLFVRKDK